MCGVLVCVRYVGVVYSMNVNGLSCCDIRFELDSGLLWIIVLKLFLIMLIIWLLKLRLSLMFG